jgi:hypothetical protein
MWHPQPDRPSDVYWLRDLIEGVSASLTVRGGKRAAGERKRSTPVAKVVADSTQEEA